MAVAIDDIVIAVVTLLVSIGASEAQQRNAEQRAARETEVRKYYQAVEDRWGITLDQLNQAANKLDLDLTRIKDASRGSARLSQASKICREYVKLYPERVKAINSARSDIQNAINNLKAKENQRASEIQRRQKVSNKDILLDVSSQAGKVSSAVGSVNTALKDGQTDGQTGMISTGLVDASNSANNQTRYKRVVYTRKQNNRPITTVKYVEDPNGDYFKNEDGTYRRTDALNVPTENDSNNQINTGLQEEKTPEKEG